jgi:hypothetical protein
MYCMNIPESSIDILRYNRNIVESGIKHRNPNSNPQIIEDRNLTYTTMDNN